MQVVLAEVLAPVGHAVHLVDNKSVNQVSLVELFKHLQKSGRFYEFFRGQIDKLVLNCLNFLIKMAHLFLFLGLVTDREGNGRN